jgi:hypothetical protein
VALPGKPFVIILKWILNIFFSDFCTRFAHCLPVAHFENLDLSHNAIEDKGRFTRLQTVFLLSKKSISANEQRNKESYDISEKSRMRRTISISSPWPREGTKTGAKRSVKCRQNRLSLLRKLKIPDYWGERGVYSPIGFIISTLP